MSDNELGAFLRTRREAVTPAEVGLPSGRRRRTPGLRRAELATLAGLSVEYLTRLEQGRDRHPSMQVLVALAEVLRLSQEERIHLRILTKSHGVACLAVERPSREVRATVRALLDRLAPAPAYVVNRLGDVLAFTTGYAQLAGPIGGLDTDPPNLVRYVFTDARARTAYPAWGDVADQLVADLKRESGPTDPHVMELVEELTLTAGSEFTRRWQEPAAVPRRTGVHRWVHPQVGEFRLAYETLGLAEADDQRLVALLPVDEAASAALDRLTGRQPGALRAVPGAGRSDPAGARSA